MRRVVATGLALSLGLTTPGCTLVGYGIGSGLDRWKEVPRWKMETVKPGTTIELQLSDGTVRRGRFVSVLRSPEDAYEKEYEEARRALHEQVILPPLGPSQIADTDGQVINGVLIGFDPDCVLFRAAATAVPVRINFSHVATVRSEGVPPLTSAVIARLVRLRAIPVISMVQLGAQPPIAPVPLNRVVEVSYRGNGARTAGTLIGLTVDALFVAYGAAFAAACAKPDGC